MLLEKIYTPEVILSIFRENTNSITRTIELKNFIWFYIYERGGEAGKAYKSGSRGIWLCGLLIIIIRL